jgi:AhpD family alkylhydroperoxidase
MIKYITPASRSTKGLTAQVYKQIRRDFGALVEPFTLHSPCPELLAAVWAVCHETELTGIVDRELKEIVASSVSKHNRCPYCVDAHAVMLHASGEEDAASLILYEQDHQVDDHMKNTVHWTKAVTSPNFHFPIERLPFNKNEAPEFIGTAVFYCYINRMVNILLGESPLPLQTKTPAVKNFLLSIGALMFGQAIKLEKRKGESLPLLPDAPLPEDLSWAKPNQFTAAAYARMAHVIEELGKKYLSENVRTYARDYLQTWKGDPPPISRSWVEPHVEKVPAQDQPALRLVLLTAVLSEQVDAKIINEFRAVYGGSDEKLIGVLAWASFSSARRVGTWLAAS